MVRVVGFWSSNYSDYESNRYKNKTLLLGDCLNKIRPYLKDIINDLKKSVAWKTQLTIAMNFISSKVMHVMHS